MDPIVFTGITPEKYAALIEKAKQEVSITPEPNGGLVSTHGVEVRWTYLDETLTVTVLSKPFYVSVDHIKALFDGWLAEAEPVEPVTEVIPESPIVEPEG